jgi:Fe-S oxidoreductase
MEKSLGVSAKRELPHFARQTFVHWFNKRPQPDNAAHNVVLFADTLTNYSYPHIAIAAVEVLEAAGCAIQLAGVTESGRPAFSKGLVAQARKAAQQVLDHLAPFAKQGLTIIFLEPSDLSAILDDYASLLPSDERVSLVAVHCLSFEQYLARRADAGELHLTFTGEARQVLLHGHCHQKALIGTGPAKRVLALPPNYTVTEVDTSCCGMAGTFGYEAEHYDISLKMAERRLLPAVRAADAATIIAAAGLSCRQQIQHGAEREALHPAQVLRDALVSVD